MDYPRSVLLLEKTFQGQYRKNEVITGLDQLRELFHRDFDTPEGLTLTVKLLTDNNPEEKPGVEVQTPA